MAKTIYQNSCGWWFQIETLDKHVGPFKDEHEAMEQFNRYCLQELGFSADELAEK